LWNYSDFLILWNKSNLTREDKIHFEGSLEDCAVEVLKPINKLELIKNEDERNGYIKGFGFGIMKRVREIEKQNQG
jgi:hypothetical protein